MGDLFNGFVAGGIKRVETSGDQPDLAADVVKAARAEANKRRKASDSTQGAAARTQRKLI